jgi:hypothetical protein
MEKSFKIIEINLRTSFYYVIVIILVSFMSFIMAGCTVSYLHEEKAIYRDNLVSEDSGIIIGRVTTQAWTGSIFYKPDDVSSRGIGFIDCATGHKTVYFAGHYFWLRLPVGEYNFDGIGTRVGGFQAVKEPFKFYVTKDEIKYIGSFVAERDLQRHLLSIAESRRVKDSDVIASRLYEAQGLRVRFYIIDEREDVIAYFLKKFPEFSNKKIIVDFMQ